MWPEFMVPDKKNQRKLNTIMRESFCNRIKHHSQINEELGFEMKLYLEMKNKCGCECMP